MHQQAPPIPHRGRVAVYTNNLDASPATQEVLP